MSRFLIALSWALAFAALFLAMGALWFWAVNGMAKSVQTAWIITVVVVTLLAVIANVFGETT